MTTHTQSSADSLPSPSTPETTTGPQPLQWLVPERIPLGRITLLTGPVDSGKTAVAADLAYKIARAMPWPATGAQPAAESAAADSRPNFAPSSLPKATVLFLTPFHDPQETALARLLAATGRPENIVMTAPEWKGESPLATLITQLDRTLSKCPSIKLVIIDPMAPLVSTALAPARQLWELIPQFAAMASRRNVSILAVMRSAGRWTGSLRQSQLYDQAAAVYALSFDCENPNQRIMQTLKFPGCQPPPALQVEILPSGVTCKINEAIAAVPVWARWTPSQAAAGQQISLAADFLQEILAAGPIQSGTVLTMARAAGIAPRTLYRAKKAIGVKSYRVRAIAGFTWVWSINRVPSENFAFIDE